MRLCKKNLKKILGVFMKKVFLLFTSLLITFLSISCSSVPKKAAADKPLVIGIVSMYFPEKVSYQGDSSKIRSRGGNHKTTSDLLRRNYRRLCNCGR